MSELVPEGWEVKILGDFLVSLPKSTLPSGVSDKAGYYSFYVCSQNVLKSFHNEMSSPAVLFSTGGEAAVHYATGEYSYSTDVWATNFTGEIYNEYAFRILDSHLEKINYSGFQGSGIKHLDKGFVQKLTFATPPIPEQKKIASILKSIDEVIEETQSQINKLQDLKKGVMNELLTKGIGHTEFKDSELGRIPKSWEVKKLANCLDKIVDCEHKTAPKVENSDFFVVPTNAVKDEQLIYTEIYKTSEDAFIEWTARTVPQAGDLMFTREAPAGESCFVPENINVCLGQRMVLLRPKKEILEGRFLNYFLNSQVGQNNIYRFSLGTTVSRINMEDIRKLHIPVPSIDEQKTISEIILSYDSMIHFKKVNHGKFQSLKKSLMQDLLTGKVRVQVGVSMKSGMNNQKRPLSPLDSESQTEHCRHSTPNICKNNSTPDKCAFVRDDNICLLPPQSWKKLFKELSEN